MKNKNTILVGGISTDVNIPPKVREICLDCASLKEQLATKDAEIERLKDLVVCSECGSCPDWNIKPIAAGWMPHLCPGCQSDIMYGDGETKLEALNAFVADIKRYGTPATIDKINMFHTLVMARINTLEE